MNTICCKNIEMLHFNIGAGCVAEYNGGNLSNCYNPTQSSKKFIPHTCWRNEKYTIWSPNSLICLAVTVEAKGTLQCGVKCHQTNVMKALHAIWMLRPLVLQVEINKVMLYVWFPQ